MPAEKLSASTFSLMLSKNRGKDTLQFNKNLFAYPKRLPSHMEVKQRKK